MKIAFLGTPEAATPPLRALVNAGYEVEVVITRPDRRRGRGSDLVASPVKKVAQELGLRVEHSLKALDELNVEIGIVVAYGAMISATLLERIPMLNVHFSLLPRWRGAAPVERAILAGDVETGVGIMSLEPTLDTGPLHCEKRTLIGEKSAANLTAELAELGAAALLEVLASPDLLANATPQQGEPTYAEKLTKETFRLLPSMNVELFRRTVRLGGAYCMIGAKRLRVDETASAVTEVPAGQIIGDRTGVYLGLPDGSVRLVRVQPEGAKPMASEAWWAGTRANEIGLHWD